MYPNYQQPQGYGQAAPYAQPPQQQYTPPPAQPAVATGIVDATNVTGGVNPFVRELVGRVVLIRPLFVEKVPGRNAQPGEPLKDRITAEVIICDGGPLAFGAKVQPETPATHRVETPARFTSMWIQGINMVKALLPLVGSGQAMLGEVKVGVGTKGNPPYNIIPLNAGDPRRDAAINIMAQVTAGQIAWPEPVAISGPPVYAPQTLATGYPAQYVPQQPYAMPPQYVVPTQYVPGQPAPAQYAVPPVGYVGAQGPAYAPQQSASPAPAPGPQMPAQGAGPGGMYMPQDVAPQGWPAEVWAQMTQQQKDQIRVQAAAPANATGF